MNARSPFVAHAHLKAEARRHVEAVPFRKPIQRKAIPAWLWVVTLAPWLVVVIEVFA